MKRTNNFTTYLLIGIEIVLTIIFVFAAIHYIINIANSPDKIMFIINNPIILLIAFIICILGIIATIKS